MGNKVIAYLDQWKLLILTSVMGFIIVLWWHQVFNRFAVYWSRWDSLSGEMNCMWSAKLFLSVYKSRVTNQLLAFNQTHASVLSGMGELAKRILLRPCFCIQVFLGKIRLLMRWDIRAVRAYKHGRGPWVVPANFAHGYGHDDKTEGQRQHQLFLCQI